MQLQRKALYNLLRMNWLLDPALKAAPWQTEDYRSLSLDELFDQLHKEDVKLDRASFIAFAEGVDSPEELADHLLSDREGDIASEDHVYLLVFELWRRLLPEKPCLSVFCDELDHQISLYDSGEVEHFESLQDALANLKSVLDENTDQGGSPDEVFKAVSEGCANDLGDFLYDFITDQIDEKNESYAADLLDWFYSYLSDSKWFDLLHARLVAGTDEPSAEILLRKLVVMAKEEADLEFNLELLSVMVQGGERSIFVNLVKQTLPLIQTEEEFSDLLHICADYYQRLDYDKEERALQRILENRLNLDSTAFFKPSDPGRKELIGVIEKRSL